MKRLLLAACLTTAFCFLAPPVQADGSVYCVGVGQVASDAACQAALEARERGVTAAADAGSREAPRQAADPGPQMEPRIDAEPELLAPQRPANIHVSTTDGVTTIGWAPPINVDAAHCPIYCYAVEVVGLDDEDVVYDSGDVFGLAVTTGTLTPGQQYDVEVSAYSQACEQWSDTGVYTYQY